MGGVTATSSDTCLPGQAGQCVCAEAGSVAWCVLGDRPAQLSPRGVWRASGLFGVFLLSLGPAPSSVDARRVRPLWECAFGVSVCPVKKPPTGSVN